MSDNQSKLKVIACIGGAVGAGCLIYWLSKKITASAIAPKNNSDVPEVAVTTSNMATPLEGESSAAIAPKACANDLTTKTDTVSDANTAKNKGNDAYKKKDFKSALVHYSEAIAFSKSSSLSPKDVAPFYGNRAACYMQLADMPNVINECTLALELDPHYVKAFYRRAQALEQLKKKREALYDYTTITMLETTNGKISESGKSGAEALTRVVREIATELGEIEKLKGVRAFPSRFTMQVFFDGFSDFHDVEMLTAVEITSLISKNSEDGTLYYRRAQANAQASSFDTVVDDANTAFEKLKGSPVCPSLINAINLLGTMEILRGNSLVAKEKFQEALVLDPENSSVHLRLALSCLDIGDFAGCNQELAIVEKSDPTNPDLYSIKAQVSMFSDKSDDAIAQFRRAIDLGHKGHQPYLQLAAIQMAAKKITESGKTIKEALEKFPNEIYLHLFIFQQHLATNNFQEAATVLDRAYTLNPTHPIVLMNKAIMFLQIQGNFTEGYAMLKEALTHDPLNIETLSQLGQFEVELNNFDAAIGHFNVLIQHVRSNDELTQALAMREHAAAKKYVLESGIMTSANKL